MVQNAENETAQNAENEMAQPESESHTFLAPAGPKRSLADGDLAHLVDYKIFKAEPAGSNVSSRNFIFCFWAYPGHSFCGAGCRWVLIIVERRRI